jgi:serine/threonine protein phosphatase PrpC
LSPPLSFHGRTDVGCQREVNEDSILAERLPDGSTLLAVFDGMGGHEAGEVASRIGAETALAELRDRERDFPALGLRHTLFRANQAILDRAAEQGTPSMGSTAVIAHVIGHSCWVGWIGDSRLYLFRSGRLTERTRDHTVVQEKLDAGTITPEEAAHHRDKHALSRVLGGGADPSKLAPDVWPEPLTLQQGDALVLCSDGLHDLVTPEEIPPLIAGVSCERATQTLVDLAKSRGGHDNISVIVLLAGEAPPLQRQLPPSASPTDGPSRPSLPGPALAGIVGFSLLIAAGLVLWRCSSSPEESDRVALAPEDPLPSTVDSAEPDLPERQRPVRPEDPAGPEHTAPPPQQDQPKKKGQRSQRQRASSEAQRQELIDQISRRSATGPGQTEDGEPLETTNNDDPSAPESAVVTTTQIEPELEQEAGFTKERQDDASETSRATSEEHVGVRDASASRSESSVAQDLEDGAVPEGPKERTGAVDRSSSHDATPNTQGPQVRTEAEQESNFVETLKVLNVQWRDLDPKRFYQDIHAQASESSSNPDSTLTHYQRLIGQCRDMQDKLVKLQGKSARLVRDIDNSGKKRKNIRQDAVELQSDCAGWNIALETQIKELQSKIDALDSQIEGE